MGLEVDVELGSNVAAVNGSDAKAELAVELGTSKLAERDNPGRAEISLVLIELARRNPDGGAGSASWLGRGSGLEPGHWACLICTLSASTSSSCGGTTGTRYAICTSSSRDPAVAANGDGNSWRVSVVVAGDEDMNDCCGVEEGGDIWKE